LHRFQAISYVCAFFWLDGFAVPSPAQDQTLACLILEFGAAKLLLQIVTIIGAVAQSWDI